MQSTKKVKTNKKIKPTDLEHLVARYELFLEHIDRLEQFRLEMLQVKHG